MARLIDPRPHAAAPTAAPSGAPKHRSAPQWEPLDDRSPTLRLRRQGQNAPNPDAQTDAGFQIVSRFAEGWPEPHRCWRGLWGGAGRHHRRAAAAASAR
jgi:hypothetical protein